MAEGGNTSGILDSDKLAIGNRIKCRYQGGEVEGQIQAFDSYSRLLIIKSAASNGKAGSSDMTILNVDCVEDLSVNGSAPVDALKTIDYAKLGKRRARAVDQKQAKIRALSADVSPEGKKLCLSLMKSVPEVSWEGEKLIVLKDVIVSPPYRVENVTGGKDAAVVLVKKIVEKHWKELDS